MPHSTWTSISLRRKSTELNPYRTGMANPRHARFIKRLQNKKKNYFVLKLIFIYARTTYYRHRNRNKNNDYRYLTTVNWKTTSVQRFPLPNGLKNSKRVDNVECAKEMRKLIAASENRFTNFDEYKKISEIYSSPFRADVESASECPSNGTRRFLQCNTELKHTFSKRQKQK